MTTNDLVNIRLSKEASEIAESLKTTGKFDDAVTAAKFALAYAIKYHFDDVNPATYAVPDSGGSNYNIGSIDSDGQLAVLLRAIYPETTTPYLYARALMVFGLVKLGERIHQEGFSSVCELM